MKIDSGLPAIMAVLFVGAFLQTALDEGSFSAAWRILGEDIVRWIGIAAVALACWLAWKLIQKARGQP